MSKKRNVVRNKPIPEKLVGQTFLDPTYDTGFQELFDDKDAIRDFLEGLLDLRGKDKIKDLEYTFNHATRFRVPQSRKIIMDAFVTTDSGRMLDIEMQRAEHSFFVDRAILYKAFLVIKGKQKMEESNEFKKLPREEKEYRRYELPEVISIWICNFDMPEFCGDYIDEWAIYSRNSILHGKAEPIFPKNRYIMVSLQNFSKKAHEVKSVADVWIYLLKNAGSEKDIPDFGSDIVKEALERIRVDNLDDETLKTVEREMTTKEEMACCLAFAKRKMAEEVRKEVAEEAECRIAGAKIDTQRETKLEMVDAMLANGKLTDQEISVISGMTLEEIQKRRAQR